MTMWSFGITQWSLPGNPAYTLPLAKQLGFDGVQLDFGSWEAGMPLSHKRLQKLYLEESRELGIRLLPLTVNALCRYGIVEGFSTPDGQIAQSILLSALDTAAAMELEGVTLPSFGANQIKTPKHLENTAAALRFACERAEKMNLNVYTENVLDPSAMEALFLSCASPRLRLLFDSQNYSVFGHDYAPEVLCAHWDRLGSHLHVKDGGDMGAMLLGSGSSPFAGVMDILKARGYSGVIVLENNYGAFPLCAQSGDPFSLILQDMDTLRRWQQ